MSITNTRTLGLGFGPGNEFHIDLNAPNCPVDHPLSKNEACNLREWIKQPQGRKVTDVLNRKALVNVLPDVLIDLDIPSIAKLPVQCSTFQKKNYLSRLDSSFLRKLNITVKQLKAPKTKEEHLQWAYLIPALLKVMDQKDRECASSQIAQLLKPKQWRSVAEADYFLVRLSSITHPVKMNSNGRSLRFFPRTVGTKAHFRGKVWELDHSHIHFERDGEEREYVLNPAPKNVAGEVHTVFYRQSKQGYKKFMAVGAPLTIGTPNRSLRRLFSQRVPTLNLAKVFLNGFDSEHALYHSWASLQSKSQAFVDGLRFSLSLQPIEVSCDQYEMLKLRFGKMQELKPDLVLNPIARS